MDQPLPKRRGKYLTVAAGILLAIGGMGGTVWYLMPRGLQIADGDIRIARAEQGMLRNDIVVRASAAPMHTILLDSIESVWKKYWPGMGL